MTDAPPTPAPDDRAREARLRREARALRDNLLRRKAQARGRAPEDPPPAASLPED